jgi:chemotaxis protein methyltransferase CheR
MTPQSFQVFATVLRAGSGLSIGPDKGYLLETRLAPLLKRTGMAGLDALAERLRSPAQTMLAREVIEAMTTNESFFFRDDRPFTHMRKQTLPRLHAVRPAGGRVRIWSAAASTGQEAYSLAMLVAEDRMAVRGREVEILGTDIAREPLARAREGIYSQFEIQRGLPMQMLVKYFRKDGAQWQLADAVRNMVSFREWNLLGDLRPLGQFDVVFCRNVLIYFDQVTKSRVLDAIAHQLVPDGLLYLGGAETVLGISNQFVPSGSNFGVYELATAKATKRERAVA